MREIAPFISPNSEYFEHVAARQFAQSYRCCIESHLTSEWRIDRFELWWRVGPIDAVLERQGFKLHVSAIPANAMAILGEVVPVCVQHGVTFKVIGDVDLLVHLNSKHHDRGSSGKFITIYPPDMDTFRRLASDIHERTHYLEGPYILSDRRYPDSRVLFYRYGGFLPDETLTAEGTRQQHIISPTGQRYLDSRTPDGTLPPWVQDPFPSADVPTQTGPIGTRYLVQSSLTFSNSGGVYKATDTSSGETVVIKEARPHTASQHLPNGLVADATYWIANETRILSRLQGLNCVPRLIDTFQQWEHSFLVESYVPGVTFARFRSEEKHSLLPFEPAAPTLAKFCQIFFPISRSLISGVAEIHTAGVILADLSPNNIIVDPATLRITLLDFETAIMADKEEKHSDFSRMWGTPGYRSRMRRERPQLKPDDDWYALGMLLYSMILPVQALFDLEPDASELILERIMQVMHLPHQIGDTIRALLSGDYVKALELVSPENEAISVDGFATLESAKDVPLLATSPGHLRNEIAATLQGIQHFLEGNYDTSRSDRLFPSDYRAYQTNPLSIAFGACGPLVLLYQLGATVPEEAANWVASRALSWQKIPVGLLSGLAGIAWAHLRMNRTELGVHLLREALRRASAADGLSFGDGIAGIGQVCLHAYARTEEPFFLEQARILAEQIVMLSKEQKGIALLFGDQASSLAFGLNRGLAGISLFLTTTHQGTGERSFLELAQRLLDRVLESAMTTEHGIAWKRQGTLNTKDPYLHDGSAGIALALLHLWRSTGELEHLQAAMSAAEYAYSRFAVLPSMFEGLSGIGEVMLDFYEYTGDELYSARALAIAESILCYRIFRREGTIFPGRGLLRISADYAYGASGIAAYLLRVQGAGACSPYIADFRRMK